MIPKPCISCGELTTDTRCQICERHYQSARNAQPARRYYADPLWRAIVMESKCAICGAITDLVKDHIIPIAKGGTNAPQNAQTLCRKCNSSKGAR